MREIIDQWEVDTKRSSLRLLCFPGIPDRTRHRTSSRYYLHQPPARPFVSLYSRPHFEYTYKTRIFGVPFHDHATREVQGVRFYLYPSISKRPLRRYSRIYVSFIHPFSCNEKEQCYETRNIHIYILFIIYIRISFNPPPSLGNYPESLLCHFPPFSYHFHSCTAFVRLPHCFLAFHRTCTDRPVRGRITQHCRSPLSLSLSLSCIN